MSSSVECDTVQTTEFSEGGKYSISLRRFPRESGLAINEPFAAQEKIVELDRTMRASVKSDFLTPLLRVWRLTHWLICRALPDFRPMPMVLLECLSWTKMCAEKSHRPIAG